MSRIAVGFSDVQNLNVTAELSSNVTVISSGVENDQIAFVVALSAHEAIGITL